MPTPTLAPTRLLKPDRTIIRPGWDDAPPDRPRAGRSRWWRRLLSGRAGLTRLQPGACCGCASPGCSCGTCTGLPSTMTLSYNEVTYVDFAEQSSTPTTITLTKDAGCSWSGPIVGLSNLTSPSCLWSLADSQWTWQVRCNIATGKLDLTSSGGCGSGGGSGCNFAGSSATTYSCSPLDIAYAGVFLAGAFNGGGHNVLCRLENLTLTG